MFVVFEGIDGSGKTTISNLAAAWLRAHGLTVDLRGGGKFSFRGDAESARVRAGRAQPGSGTFAEFFLYVTRDVQLLEGMTGPAVGRADLVIADRFLYSAEVLTRHGRGTAHACGGATFRARRAVSSRSCRQGEGSPDGWWWAFCGSPDHMPDALASVEEQAVSAP
jgi:hypothetical protein